jgi:hypothetical protein
MRLHVLAALIVVMFAVNASAQVSTAQQPTGVAAAVDPSVLQESFTDLMQNLGGVFGYIGTVSGFAIDEVQLHLGLTAEGKIGILGSGMSVGAESSITVTLRRPSKP